MAYLLDANVFITAKNLHYGLDFCPAFWDWLAEANADGRVLSIEKVGDELLALADDLSVWADAMGASFFVPPDPSVLAAMAAVSTWANSQEYTSAAVHVFLQGADYWLIAHALAGRHVVVTHERPSTSVHKIKIPDACVGLRVKPMTPFEMLRRERARFVLGSGA